VKHDYIVIAGGKVETSFPTEVQAAEYAEANAAVRHDRLFTVAKRLSDSTVEDPKVVTRTYPETPVLAPWERFNRGIPGNSFAKGHRCHYKGRILERLDAGCGGVHGPVFGSNYGWVDGGPYPSDA